MKSLGSRFSMDRLRAVDPIVEGVYGLVQGPRRLVREHDPAVFKAWLDAARTCSVRKLSGFAAYLERDRTAVEAELRLPWSNGQTEGQVTRLKLNKRQMYGRANFDPSRLRVLHRG